MGYETKKERFQEARNAMKYDFPSEKAREFPPMVILDVCNVCNLECIHCPHVTLKKEGRGRDRKYAPYVFTENGVAMLSSILRSERAIQVNIQIMRAFTKIREWLATHRGLQEKIKKLERKFDKKFAVVFNAIQLLLDAPEKSFRIKGFEK